MVSFADIAGFKSVSLQAWPRMVSFALDNPPETKNYLLKHLKVTFRGDYPKLITLIPLLPPDYSFSKRSSRRFSKSKSNISEVQGKRTKQTTDSPSQSPSGSTTSATSSAALYPIQTTIRRASKSKQTASRSLHVPLLTEISAIRRTIGQNRLNPVSPCGTIGLLKKSSIKLTRDSFSLSNY